MLERKVIFFCILAYLFQFAIETITISSNAFFIDVLGAEELPKALIISSVLTPLIIIILAQMERLKNSRQYKIIVLLIISILYLAINYYYTAKPNVYENTVWMYQIFGNLFSLVSIIFYWNLINSYFYVFESKLYFSYFIIAEEVGAITSDILINKVLYSFSLFQYFLFDIFVLIILMIAYLYVFRIKKVSENEDLEEEIPKIKLQEENIFRNKHLFNLVFLYVVIICLFHFVSAFINYQFNYSAGIKYSNSQELNKFFSEFQLISSVLIIFTSYLFSRFLYTKSKIIMQHVIYGFSLLFLVYLMNLEYTFYMIAAVELIKIVLEHSLFQTSYEHFTASFTEKIGDKIRNYTEGLFIPMVIVISAFGMSFFPDKFDFYYLNFNLLLCISVVIFLAFLIKNYYYKYHMSIVKNDFDNIRSTQALGEKNNIKALDILISNYEKAEDKFSKKNIIIAIGKINSEKTIEYIYSVINSSDEFLQAAAIEALFEYKAFKVDYLLLQFVVGQKNKSFYIRHRVISFINNTYKNAIIPFFMHLLYSDDYRIVANTIENFWNIKDRNIIPIVIKFLNHKNNRVRANVIILIYKFNISYYNNNCLLALDNLKKSREISDNLSFVFVVGFLCLRKYSKSVELIYENLKNRELFKEQLVENFSFCFSALDNPIGNDLFQLQFIESNKFPQTLLYKFRLLTLLKRVSIINSFIQSGFGEQVVQNLLTNFKNSIYDFSFELEMIEEILEKQK